MCVDKKRMLNPRYKPNKKNGGYPPFCDDERTRYIDVDCGKCNECRQKKARDWRIRMTEELKQNKEEAKFVTLTFDEEWLKIIREEIGEDENEIAKKAVRRFLERWRKQYKKSIRHWLVTELGHTGTERIHLHGIIWTNKTTPEISRIWKYGMIWIGEYVNEKTINYIVKYIHKQDEDHPEFNGKVLCSPGLGSEYTNSSQAKLIHNKNRPETMETYVTREGYRLALPRYYRNKIYNEKEREKMWIEKIESKVEFIGNKKYIVNNREIRRIVKRIKRQKYKNELRLGFIKKKLKKINKKKLEE